MSKQLDTIFDAVREELNWASENNAPFNSAHEGYAVLLEEVEELWNAVKLNWAKHPERNEEMTEEAIQVAAMAIRFLHDVCDLGGSDHE